jgi:hypothetical protein
VHTVKRFIRVFVVSVLFAFCALSLNGCSGGPSGDSWRYDPGIPAQVIGLKAEPGMNLVTLSWTGSSAATTYRIYYVSELTETGVTKTNGNVINTTFKSLVLRGLDNNIRYYFMVTALNHDGESIESVQVSAIPRPISQSDLMPSSLLNAGDIADTSSLSAQLQNDSNPATMPVSKLIWRRLDAVTQKSLVDPNSTLSQRQTVLVQGLNKVLQGNSIYDTTLFAGVPLRSETQALQSQNPTGESLVHLNRLLLEDAYPRQIVKLKYVGTWYFHTLVTGQGAKWERGTMTVTMDTNGVCNAVISDFQDSANYNPDYPSATITAPPGFSISVGGDGVASHSGVGAWPCFHGTMGSRKNMMVATWSPSLTSRAITIFQRKKADSDPDYTIEDIAGTGSGQNPNNPYIQGNGPTRFAYHQLYSGSNTEWEYSNGKVGKKGQFQVDVKDIIYWDYATPTYKVDTGIDILTKATGFLMDSTGLVTEYWNYANVADPVESPSFNYLVPRKPYDAVFTGRMTADKTVVVGVSTRTDVNGANPRYFLRIMELCFIPTDQALPIYSLNDLAGDYKFHKISSSFNAPLSGYGVMSITGSGMTSFSDYVDDVSGSTAFPDTFALVYCSDASSKAYSDFANFVTPDPAGGGGSGLLHYYFDGDINKPYHTYYDFFNNPNTTLDDYIDINDPSTWLKKAISKYYYNEHGSLSYNMDLFVLTRTDSSGNSLIIGLK